ncbi:MAG: hypothetical protein KR126chlam6_00197 [Candidatus Anoxychlamydiales bacterium]|nr:hypothetical protein [Candidatus Anoxychlamydiales bacterium]
MYPTIIIRHKKENLKKCSLRGLEKRENICFYSYPLKNELPDFSNYFLLEMNAPELKAQDQDKGILLIDSTWKYLAKILKILPENIEKRSLPKNYISAYPRKQTMCTDPIRGLASIEALYLAYMLTKRDITGILDNYYWKEQFLSINKLL